MSLLLRSIPACAGEPVACGAQELVRPVYPRVCGGTEGFPRNDAVAHGLSPRVRGNQGVTAAQRKGPGSIPACAGEPPVVEVPRNPVRVYPRVCGGTDYYPSGTYYVRGLSPRVRGNLSICPRRASRDRSIPACAGEPSDSGIYRLPRRVYPRVCGGTSGRLTPSPSVLGLSPRVRGNHTAGPFADVWPRSIPACAGEPLRLYRSVAPSGVYPRVCGGTQNSGSSSSCAAGLSPRVRGNRRGH